MAKKKPAAEVHESPTPRRNPETALSRDDILEIAGENLRLKRALDSVADAVEDEDLDGAADALKDAGFEIDRDDDEDEDD